MSSGKKIAILIGDGMADLQVESLGCKTLLEYADIPNMDFAAQHGICGLARTVPDGLLPGSDTANLSIFGYNPRTCYTGRAPLEALNMGIELGENDAAFRCNFVNIEDDVMKDFSAGHIESAFSAIIIEELKKNISIPGIEFYPGVSYRNIVVWRNYPYDEIVATNPPHDIHGKKISGYLPSGKGSGMILELMKMSEKIISESKAVKEAFLKHKGTPVSAWIWGGGRRPAIETLKKRFGLYGYTISAVDLINGIGRAAGLEPITVPGATGYIDTNYEGKADALLAAMEKCNYVYLHVESPDESGHEGSIEKKLKSIADFDSRVVKRVLEGMRKFDDYAVLIMPDHPTPVSIRTHTADPVPFCIFGKGFTPERFPGVKKAESYSESSALSTGLFVNDAHRLVEIILSGKLNPED